MTRAVDDDPDMAALQRSFDALVAQRRAAAPRERAHAEEVARLTRERDEAIAAATVLCPACGGRGVVLYARETEDGCDECAATGRVNAAAEVARLRGELLAVRMQATRNGIDASRAEVSERAAVTDARVATQELRDVAEAIDLPWMGAAGVAGGVRLALDALRRVADCARRERSERAAWLASLPAGTCASPPPRALTDAERETGEALEEVK